MNKLSGAILSALLAVSIITPAISAQTFNKELGEVRSYAGSSNENYVNGQLSVARFSNPSSFASLGNGDIVIADSGNHAIRKLSNNQVTTLAGSPYSLEGRLTLQGSYLDGKGTEAAFNAPTGLVVAKDGAIYVADSENHAIRKVSIDGTVQTIAGNGEYGLADGKASEANFNVPSDVVLDSKGNIYVADTLNHAIRKISVDGNVTTLNKPSSRLVEYTQGAIDAVGDYKDGPLSQAMFNEPTALLIDANDNLYVSDRGNQRIRYIDFTTNTVSTVAGSGELHKEELYVEGGYVDGDASTAKFFSPEGMTWLDEETILVADRKNHTVRQIKKGVVSTLTGTAEEYGNANGVAQSALFNEPADILVQADGTILILEAGNNQIRKLAHYTNFISASFTNEIEVVVNGKVLSTKAELINSRTLLPLRAVGNELNLTVHYDEKTKKITLSNATTKFEFLANESVVTKTEAGVMIQYKLDSPATNMNNTTYIPVRFISEQLQLHVAWDSQLKNVVIRDYIFD